MGLGLRPSEAQSSSVGNTNILVGPCMSSLRGNEQREWGVESALMLILALGLQAQYFVPNRSPIALIDGFDEGVQRVRDGKRFAARRVDALQKGNIKEEGFEHQEVAMPSLPSMEELHERRSNSQDLWEQGGRYKFHPLAH
ncbi:hypothetical protein CFP56_039004 [Quercus suber]|uniref:Uncharacterized protein n=1 Tax=Quercus suber TaxID=58331 RepID=A0AAW0J0V7_QUESU